MDGRVLRTIDDRGGGTPDLPSRLAALDHIASQLERTFKTDVFGCFLMTKAAVSHLRKGSSIIDTTSVTDYSTKVPRKVR